MNPNDSAWQKLTAAARRAPVEPDVAAPFGFATRVAALAMAAGRRPAIPVLERLSWRALGVAALLALISAAANYSSFAKTVDDDSVFGETAVTAIFDASS